jgi:peptide/nickel transport system permease protein
MSLISLPGIAKARRDMLRINLRTRTLGLIALTLLVLATVVIVGGLMNADDYAPNYAAKKLWPSLSHLFGTDYMGRDMFARTLKGLSVSMQIGFAASLVSATIAITLGILAATLGRGVDRLVNWLVDLSMGIPHLLQLILISFMLGGGIKGVAIAVAVTHWPPLTRIIRAEVMQILSAPYVHISRGLGRGRFWVARKHIFPQILPQCIVGLILMFPHAILHEAAITFVGFGVPLDMPAVGSILAESMKHLATGMWWLALFPGLALLMVVLLFNALGSNVRLLTDPRSAHR